MGSTLCRFLEIPSGFRLQYFALSLGLLALSLIELRGIDRSKLARTIVLLVSLCLAINAAEILPYYIPQRDVASEQGGTPLKLLSFNVLGSNKNTNAVVEYVQLEDPDVAVFFEAVDHWPAALAKLRVSHPHHLPVQVTQFEIYSKYPIHAHRLHFYGDYRGFLELTLDVNGQHVKVVAFHAYPTLYFGKRGMDLRNDQLQGLTDVYAGHQGPLAVIGDFNVDIWSPHYKTMMRNLGLRNACKGKGVRRTHCMFPEARCFWWLSRPIDLCLVSKGLPVDSLRAGPFLGSDHLPLVAELIFQPSR